LVFSTFHSKAVWSAGLEVMEGLRKGRKIYVRKPEPNENNANYLLIQKGAIAFDYNEIENASAVYSEQSP